MVTVTYGDQVIHEADSGDVFTLNTADTYCEEDFTVQIEDDDIPEAEGHEF
jgi:hypothetical protein